MKYYSGSWYVYFYQFVYSYVLERPVFSKDEVRGWIRKHSVNATDKVFPVTKRAGVDCRFDDFISKNPWIAKNKSDGIVTFTSKQGFVIQESLKNDTFLFVLRK